MVLAIKLKSKESECVALCLRKREWARQFKLKQLPLSPSPSPSLSSHNAKPKLNVQTGKSSNSNSSSRSSSRGRGTASHKWEYIYLFELSLDSESAKCGRSQSRRAVSSSRSASEIRTSNWRRFSLFVFPSKGKTTTTRKLTQKDAANSCPDDILSAKELPRVPSHYSYKWNNTHTHTRANIIYTHTHSLRQGKEWKFWREWDSERERERGESNKKHVAKPNLCLKLYKTRSTLAVSARGECGRKLYEYICKYYIYIYST